MTGRPLTLVLASANPGKAAEIRTILAAALPGVVVLPRPDDVADVVEDAPDLVGNARLKARAVTAATGRPAVADDTGLEVDALGGRPGVRSARFAGEHASDDDNVRALLEALAQVPAGRRIARFRTVALVAWPDGSEVRAEGVVEGSIAEVARGANGFGYDPVFLPEGCGGRSFAELAPEAKHEVSHRGRAFRALARALAGSTA